MNKTNNTQSVSGSFQSLKQLWDLQIWLRLLSFTAVYPDISKICLCTRSEWSEFPPCILGSFSFLEPEPKLISLKNNCSTCFVIFVFQLPKNTRHVHFDGEDASTKANIWIMHMLAKWILSRVAVLDGLSSGVFCTRVHPSLGTRQIQIARK